DRAAALGNYVRAAVLRVRAALGPHRSDRDKHLAAARSAVRNGLVKRLAPLLGWHPGTTSAWGTALVPLLDPAAKGVWPAAARARRAGRARGGGAGRCRAARRPAAGRRGGGGPRHPRQAGRRGRPGGGPPRGPPAGGGGPGGGGAGRRPPQKERDQAATPLTF